MTEQFQIYKCDICGNIVEVLHTGKGELVCCGQPMKMMDEQIADVSTEKHVPVVEKSATETKIIVGSTPHPMEEKHYIQWVQIITPDGVSIRKFLKPGDSPEAIFKYSGDIEKAREYCNIHLLWASK